jgi:hypothetical protein
VNGRGVHLAPMVGGKAEPARQQSRLWQRRCNSSGTGKLGRGWAGSEWAQNKQIATKQEQPARCENQATWKAKRMGSTAFGRRLTNPCVRQKSWYNNCR